MNLKIILTALLIVFSFSMCADAKTKVKYPPYPDVWGYDISDDAGDAYNFAIEKRLNGDYTIFYPNKNKAGRNVINVFKGEKKEFPSSKELYEYLNSRGERLRSDEVPYVSLSDGKVVDCIFGGCIYRRYVRRTTNDFEDKNDEYKLSPIGIATYCRKGKECVNKPYFLALELIGLKDDTFFAFDPQYHLFIRFDRDFKTKFKPQHTVKLSGNRELKSNFYVLPHAKVVYFFEHVAIGFTGICPFTEDINRQFLDYLYKEEQEGGI